MRRIGAIALVLWTGLACAMSAEAKPKHQPFKCKAGYTRRGVRIPKRVHGRIVRRHGRIVYIKVQRCVKTPRPKPSSPAPPRVGTPTTPTTPQPPGTTTTTTTTPSPTPSPPPPPDPVVVAVGDIAQPPGCSPCGQAATAALAQTFNPSAVFVLGDNQYESGAYSEYKASYDLTWGQDFNSIVHPVPGNHEYVTSGAAGYFQYFGEQRCDDRRADQPPGGYYSFNLGSWHIVALNSNCSTTAVRTRSPGWRQHRPRCRGCSPTLRTNTSACVLAMWHHPLFSYGWMTSGRPGVGAAVERAVQRACGRRAQRTRPHLRALRRSRIHPATRTTSGIREFVVGTGGESLNGPYGDSSTHDPAGARTVEFGVLVLTLHASSYHWKFVTTSGTTLDSGTTACHGPGAATAAVAFPRRAARVDLARLSGPPLVFDGSTRFAARWRR